jgi:regulation of enolase protein 1 (concanavalin A-like superfamily)
MDVDLSAAQWLNKPGRSEINGRTVKIITEPHTDLWQRSYYGFSHDNVPALLFESAKHFTFTVKTSFSYRFRYDQCGLIVYLDGDNWFKASIEYEDGVIYRLGSVVTNLGYSDWATTDIPATTHMWYRLSRRGPDFLIESSSDGKDFQQMRIFHLHRLGETPAEAASLDTSSLAESPIRFGLYACSPLESSFEARFDSIRLENCIWRAHSTE